MHLGTNNEVIMFKQFSPNMLKTFDLCPKKFEFKYIKNISMPVNDEVFEFGKNIHTMASYYLKIDLKSTTFILIVLII